MYCMLLVATVKGRGAQAYCVFYGVVFVTINPASASRCFIALKA